MKNLLLFSLLCLALGGCLPQAAEEYTLFSDVHENSISLQFHNRCLDPDVLKFNNRSFEPCNEENLAMCEERKLEKCRTIAAELASDAKLFVRKIGKSGNGTRTGTESVTCEPVNETQLFCKVVLGERLVSDLIAENMEFHLVAKDQRFELNGLPKPLTGDIYTPFLSIAAAQVIKEKSPDDAFGVFVEEDPDDLEDLGAFPPAAGNSGGGACSLSRGTATGNIGNLWFWILTITGVWFIKKGSAV